MHSRLAASPMQALYRVFVQPHLLGTTSRSAATATEQPLLHAAPQRIRRQQTRRPFSSTPTPSAKSRAPETRTQKWDDEISAKYIQLVDPETNKLHPPQPLSSVLWTLDTKTHRLIQLTPDPPRSDPSFVPACKVLAKKDVYAAEKKKKAQQKEQAKVSKLGSRDAMKTLEVNWAIAEGDLDHRLKRLREFLGEGRRVEIVLAAKKRARKATAGECENVLRRIREVVDGVEGGVREVEKMQGPVGGFVTMVYQGRNATAVSAASGKDGEEREGGG